MKLRDMDSTGSIHKTKGHLAYYKIFAKRNCGNEKKKSLTEDITSEDAGNHVLQ